ncbi:VOC family protein [Fulvivirgaceae bacterium BMA10]|uniref:VOC family protein n=1 Tax=Splendidivirga corallicola TaxID=3051826 RepID=A0ABT8KJ47_9BACT|nr:VOC family protein [Fulvivirgaceae bacterium BMA10]
MKLYRVILPVNDIEKAQGFYSNIFEKEGLRVSPGRHYFNLSGIILACYDPVAEGDDTGEGWKFHPNQYIYIAVDNLTQIYERIKLSGAKEVETIEEMPWGEKLFYAKDPFGNPICFVDDKTIFTGK